MNKVYKEMLKILLDMEADMYVNDSFEPETYKIIKQEKERLHGLMFTMEGRESLESALDALGKDENNEK